MQNLEVSFHSKVCERPHATLTGYLFGAAQSTAGNVLQSTGGLEWRGFFLSPHPPTPCKFKWGTWWHSPYWSWLECNSPTWNSGEGRAPSHEETQHAAKVQNKTGPISFPPLPHINTKTHQQHPHYFCVSIAVPKVSITVSLHLSLARAFRSFLILTNNRVWVKRERQTLVYTHKHRRAPKPLTTTTNLVDMASLKKPKSGSQSAVLFRGGHFRVNLAISRGPASLYCPIDTVD